jgi:hypothetical protein
MNSIEYEWLGHRRLSSIADKKSKADFQVDDFKWAYVI